MYRNSTVVLIIRCVALAVKRDPSFAVKLLRCKTVAEVGEILGFDTAEKIQDTYNHFVPKVLTEVKK